LLILLSHSGLQGVNESPPIYQSDDPAALPSRMAPPDISQFDDYEGGGKAFEEALEIARPDAL